MPWFAYAIIAAVFTSAAAIIEKKALRKEHAMEFSAVLAVIIAVFSLPLFLFIDYSKVTAEPLIILFFVSILAAIAFTLVAKGLRHMEISSTSPLLAASPAFAAILAWAFLGESLTTIQLSGFLAILIGVYVLELKRGNDLLGPFRMIVKSKYIHYILIAIVLYGFCSFFDRFILTRYEIEPIAYIAFVHVFLAINFIIMHSMLHDGLPGIIRGAKKYGFIISIMALIVITYRFAQISAIQVAYVALVLPIKRVSTLFTTLIGGELFHEHNIIRKSIAATIVILGAILLII